MNPNSANQRWSKWTFTVHSGGTRRPTLLDVQANCARFGRKAFGSASQMRVQVWNDGRVTIEVMTEGAPVHDPAFVDYMKRAWARFAVNGWGAGTTLQLETKLLAGSRQDGTPSDQLVMVSSFPDLKEVTRG